MIARDAGSRPLLESFPEQDPRRRILPAAKAFTLPRVFAIGDVRPGSTKRLATAVGEGAAVVAQVHAVLGGAANGA